MCGVRDESIAPLFRAYFVSVKCGCSGPGQGSPAYTPAAANQSAKQSTGAGTDSHIDQISVTPVKARPAIVPASVVIVTSGSIVRASIRPSVIVATVVVTAIVIAVVGVTIIRPIAAKAFSAIALSVTRER